MSIHKEKYHQLTHPQRRIWYADKINGSSQLHNIGGCVKINGKIDIKCLEKTINTLIKRNDALRLRFKEIEGEPLQYIEKFNYETIDFLDFSNYEEPKEQHEKWMKSIFGRNFDLDNKLYYFAIYRMSEKEYGYLIKIHHSICDGWGMTLVVNQISEIYSGLINNDKISLNECHSYLEYITEEQEYLNSNRFLKNKNFWNDRMKDMPEEFLYNSSDSLDGKRVRFHINSDLSKEIQKFIKDKKCSLNTFFIAMLLMYIKKNKSESESDIVIGTPVFNRNSKNQKNTVGMFTSTLPFRFKIESEMNIGDLIKGVNRELKHCFLNQKYPYDLLVKDLELSKGGYDSLFKMSVNYYNSKFINDINGMGVEIEEYYCGNQSYSLQLIVKELEDENIELNFDYKTIEYADEEINIMYKCMLNMIKKILKHEHLEINEIELVSEEEKKLMLYKFNNTNTDYPRNKTIQELFEEQVEKSPENIAVICNNEKLTYKELNEKSNSLARVLQKKGITENDIIGIMVNRSLEMIIGILGILKAGGAYLPIDPEYPNDRISYMLDDSKASILLVENELEKDITYNGKVMSLKNQSLYREEKSNLQICFQPEQLAYVIYTSGTTGVPKGVMVKQKGVVNYINWAKKSYVNGNSDFPLYSSIAFDLTVTSLYTPLITGNKIIVYEGEDKSLLMQKIIMENKVDIIKLTPTHLKIFENSDLSNSKIKKLIVGGEELKVEQAKKIYRLFNNEIDIYNEYGPTEATVGCMIYKYNAKKDKGISVPIGVPAQNTKLYVLGKNMELLPIGLAGELYVGGDGVGRGYLNKEELTDEKFVPNPYIPDERIYRTGDLARWLPDGNMEYLGRIDHQVKIRGFRIELGEIESQLLRNREIKDVVVIDKEDGCGNKYLCAYVVSEKEVKELNLRAYLKGILPEYMIPSYFINLKRIPLTLNGKLDRGELPEPNLVEVFNEYKPPRNEIEEALAKAWIDILGVNKVGINDNFYEIGGDSIKAIQISSKLKNLGLDIRVKDILTYESIGEIAATAQLVKSNRDIDNGIMEGTINNTPIIEWFFNKKFFKENVYNQYIQLEFKSSMDINHIKKSIKEIIRHHDSLRINYDISNGGLFYNNSHLEEEAVECIELAGYSYRDQLNIINKTKNEIKNGFNLENSILFKLVIFNLGEGKQSLLFMAHHLIVDGISWRIILEDFLTALKQLNNKKEIKLPMKTHSYKAWGEALKEYSNKGFDEEKAYWHSISGKEFKYPIDFNKGEASIATTNVLSGELDEGRLNNLIQRVKEIYNLELNETLTIALVIAIKDLTNKNDIIIELERHGRETIDEYIDVSRTVGWFTSMYPAYFFLDSENIDNSVKSIKEQLRNIPNKGFNYSILKYLNEGLPDDGDNSIRFNYLGDFDSVLDEETLSLSSVKLGLENNKENLLTALIDVDVMVVNKKLKINFTYSRNKFEDATIQNFIDKYVGILEMILNKCVKMDSKEFTPSDFDVIGISQEELDSLFE
ncbi:non-ribosomal peptide synthetase [Bacillus cereus]|uniref:Non-ribosomal peptide synthetase n=1 Tax=Bacillus cereus TaxID=1396 RepID=A0A9X6Z8D4_BACCE|nr:non-ribosomal peptide synthetase [Bacillus cereus]PFB27750.1 non-ribosomal peptide synthetase [Bacillus cereus]PFC14782.1 non-ribosomal peptide synthetase [Bacillus cereus]PFD20368.1 non-ribosomal peptide synthetase [Bacillus cereus]PFL71163.1 non-ribosomal peptide synthetase [Bacillus cereus]